VNEKFLSDFEYLERWRKSAAGSESRAYYQKFGQSLVVWGFSPPRKCGMKISIAKQSKLEHSASNIERMV
jgi:hypothetical protein